MRAQLYIYMITLSLTNSYQVHYLPIGRAVVEDNTDDIEKEGDRAEWSERRNGESSGEYAGDKYGPVYRVPYDRRRARRHLSRLYYTTLIY